MDALITSAYSLLERREMVIIGQDLGPVTDTSDQHIWRGIMIVSADSVEPGLHIMTLEEIRLDRDACDMMFSHLVESHFESMMGL